MKMRMVGDLSSLEVHTILCLEYFEDLLKTSKNNTVPLEGEPFLEELKFDFFEIFLLFSVLREK